MLRFVVILSALICLAVSSPAISEEGDQHLSIQGLDWDSTQIFMGGMGYGVIYFNTTLLMDGKPKLYCVPPGVGVNGRLLWDLASKVLKGPHKPDIVAVAALDELKKKYPCAK